jgi:RimJ/RimL family protein N-acetyltransferase
MTPAVLRAMLAGNQNEAGELLGIATPAGWAIPRHAIDLRLSQLEANPELQPWLVKAISLREQGILVGDIGFHTKPGPEYLAELSPGGVEFGFGVVELYRRRGIAMEASEALMCWARDVHQVKRFVLSISPDNLPSLGLAAKLGFRKIGSQIDERDGPEDIFEKHFAPIEPASPRGHPSWGEGLAQ